MNQAQYPTTLRELLGLPDERENSLGGSPSAGRRLNDYTFLNIHAIRGFPGIDF